MRGKEQGTKESLDLAKGCGRMRINTDAGIKQHSRPTVLQLSRFKKG